MWRTASEPYRAVVKHNTESHFASMEFIVKLLTTCQDVHFRVWDDEEWNVAEPDPADFFNVLDPASDDIHTYDSSCCHCDKYGCMMKLCSSGATGPPGGLLVYKLQLDQSFDKEGCDKVCPPPSEVPQALASCGVGSDDWEFCRKHIIDHQRANGFYNCPGIEAACFITGCCCCLGLPIFLCVGKYMCRNSKMKRVRCAEMSDKLAAFGIRVTFADNFFEVLMFSKSDE